MAKKRAVVVHTSGAVNVANGPGAGSENRFDLDAALQKGGKIVEVPIPIGPQGTAILLIVEEP